MSKETEPNNLGTLQEQSEWLSKGRLDAAETLGNIATAVVIKEEGGLWTVPLRGGIDVVDEADARHMKESPAYARVEEPNIMNGYTEPVVEVSWVGTDDENRRSVADIAAASFTPSEK